MAKDTKPGRSVLPKSIAGAKLPKDIRKKLIDLAKHPVVADLLAAGLVALAAKLKNEPKVQRAAAKARDRAADVAQDVAQAAADVAASVAKPADTAPSVKRVRKPAAAKTDAAKASVKPKAAPKPKALGKTAPKSRPPKTPK